MQRYYLLVSINNYQTKNNKQRWNNIFCIFEEYEKTTAVSQQPQLVNLKNLIL